MEVFDRIANLRNESPYPMLVGAVTDGNSDPRNIPALKDYFDFCINAESVGVGKPDKRVYLKAIEYVVAHPSVQDIMDEERLANGADVEDLVGPWYVRTGARLGSTTLFGIMYLLSDVTLCRWIHVGDDFTKDIVAGKSLNMRTVWARELVKKKLEVATSEKKTNDNGKGKLSPEKELLEFQKKVSEEPVVKMGIGSEDYLMESIQGEYADSIIDSFGELAGVLQKWHNESLQASNAEVDGGEGTEEKTVVDAEPVSSIAHDDEDDIISKSKFCVFCGAKVPYVAIHCSSCGKKQPQID